MYRNIDTWNEIVMQFSSFSETQRFILNGEQQSLETPFKLDRIRVFKEDNMIIVTKPKDSTISLSLSFEPAVRLFHADYIRVSRNGRIILDSIMGGDTSRITIYENDVSLYAPDGAEISVDLSAVLAEKERELQSLRDALKLCKTENRELQHQLDTYSIAQNDPDELNEDLSGVKKKLLDISNDFDAVKSLMPKYERMAQFRKKAEKSVSQYEEAVAAYLSFYEEFTENVRSAHNTGNSILTENLNDVSKLDRLLDQIEKDGTETAPVMQDTENDNEN